MKTNKPTHDDALGKALGLDADASLDAAIHRVQTVIDDLRKTYSELRRDNARIRSEIREVEERISKIERQDRAPSVTPDRWKAAITISDVPLTLQ